MGGYAWPADDVETVRINYADYPAFLIAYLVGRPVGSVHRLAHNLGLKKSEKFKNGPYAGRWDPEHPKAKAHRYPKGHVPANKGKKSPGVSPGRMAETQFKKGQRNHNWLPVGSIRINVDGYRDRKISDTGYPPRDWRGEHILLWEEHLGPLPPGHCICFKNGNKKDIRIDNLGCISRAERMRRNTIHRYPEAIKDVMRLVGRVNHQLRKRDEKQDRGSARSPVRRARGFAGPKGVIQRGPDARGG